ncbi:uncharacterized protein LOC129224954 [Uloborus diversus]|uniref:uncharacterized protein LOC129224954 n=1 Tax=Uloborus diversus TaxID=327109 RepID=UPI00240A8370|nr:uncharacterized protein LOC129224954 [Uloborus diversus]
MQKLWLCKSKSDDSLPDRILKEWTSFASQLPILENIQMPRHFFIQNSAVKCIQIHGFCDASQNSFAAVLYMRSEFEDEKVEISLIAAKTRVAPLKTIAIPRLELCAAVMLSQLYKDVVENLAIQVDESFFWTDTQIVLDWLNSEPHKWKSFISNRISQIHTNTQVDAWHHVVSKENPCTHFFAMCRDQRVTCQFDDSQDILRDSKTISAETFDI